MCILFVYTMDLFNHPILCNSCTALTNLGSINREGFQIRTLECPQCEKIIYHPLDIKEYEKFKKLKNKDFGVKLRFVGNSYCVSIPRQIIRYFEHESQNKKTVKMSIEGPDKIVMYFSEEIYKDGN